MTHKIANDEDRPKKKIKVKAKTVTYSGQQVLQQWELGAKRKKR